MKKSTTKNTPTSKTKKTKRSSQENESAGDDQAVENQQLTQQEQLEDDTTTTTNNNSSSNGNLHQSIPNTEHAENQSMTASGHGDTEENKHKKKKKKKGKQKPSKALSETDDTPASPRKKNKNRNSKSIGESSSTGSVLNAQSTPDNRLVATDESSSFVASEGQDTSTTATNSTSDKKANHKKSTEPLSRPSSAIDTTTPTPLASAEQSQEASIVHSEAPLSSSDAPSSSPPALPANSSKKKKKKRKSKGVKESGAVDSTANEEDTSHRTSTSGSTSVRQGFQESQNSKSSIVLQSQEEQQEEEASNRTSKSYRTAQTTGTTTIASGTSSNSSVQQDIEKQLSIDAANIHQIQVATDTSVATTVANSSCVAGQTFGSSTVSYNGRHRRRGHPEQRSPQIQYVQMDASLNESQGTHPTYPTRPSKSLKSKSSSKSSKNESSFQSKSKSRQQSNELPLVEEFDGSTIGSKTEVPSSIAIDLDAENGESINRSGGRDATGSLDDGELMEHEDERLHEMKDRINQLNRRFYILLGLLCAVVLIATITTAILLGRNKDETNNKDTVPVPSLAPTPAATSEPTFSEPTFMPASPTFMPVSPTILQVFQNCEEAAQAPCTSTNYELREALLDPRNSTIKICSDIRLADIDDPLPFEVSRRRVNFLGCCGETSLCTIESNIGSRILIVKAPGFTMSNMRLLGGYADSRGDIEGILPMGHCGANLLAYGPNGEDIRVSLINSHLINGTCAGDALLGGNAYISSGFGMVEVSGSVVRNGDAMEGGGLMIVDAVMVQIDNTRFEANSGTALVFTLQEPSAIDTTVNVSGSQFIGNSGQGGSSIFAYNYATAFTLSVSDSIFQPTVDPSVPVEGAAIATIVTIAESLSSVTVDWQDNEENADGLDFNQINRFTCPGILFWDGREAVCFPISEDFVLPPP